MTREERELSITYLEEMKEAYIEGEGYERHPLPEYYAIEFAIKALEQETVFDKIRAGIEELPNANPSYWHGGDMVNRDDALEIVDRYERM